MRMNMKLIFSIFFLIFIIGIIILSRISSTKNEKYKNNFKNNFSVYCTFLKELEFEGEIISIKKSFSSGQPDLIEVKCSALSYPDSTLKDKYVKKNEDTLKIEVPRTYTRLNEDKLVKGDILKSDKGDYEIYRVTPTKKKMEINILENKYDYKCQ